MGQVVHLCVRLPCTICPAGRENLLLLNFFCRHYGAVARLFSPESASYPALSYPIQPSERYLCSKAAANPRCMPLL